MRKKKNDITDNASAAGIKSGKIILAPMDENSSLTEVSAQERHQLIAEAAYYRSERRRFEPGYELEDWLTAENEIIMRLSSREV